MTTCHFVDRAKARLGINEKDAKRLAQMVTRHEKPSSKKRRSREQRWVTQRCKDGCKAIVYQGNCFIVSEDDVYITVYPLPFWYGKKAQFDNNNCPVRKPKKYAKMCGWLNNRKACEYER